MLGESWAGMLGGGFSSEHGYMLDDEIGLGGGGGGSLPYMSAEDCYAAGGIAWIEATKECQFPAGGADPAPPSGDTWKYIAAGCLVAIVIGAVVWWYYSGK